MREYYFSIALALGDYDEFLSLNSTNRAVAAIITGNIIKSVADNDRFMKNGKKIRSYLDKLSPHIILVIRIMKIINKFEHEIETSKLINIFGEIYNAIYKYRDDKCIQSNFREKNNFVYINMPFRYIYRLEKYLDEYPDDYKLFREDYDIKRLLEYKEDVVNTFKGESGTSIDKLCTICGKKLTIKFNIISCECSYCEAL